MESIAECCWRLFSEQVLTRAIGVSNFTMEHLPRHRHDRRPEEYRHQSGRNSSFPAQPQAAEFAVSEGISHRPNCHSQ